MEGFGWDVVVVMIATDFSAGVLLSGSTTAFSCWSATSGEKLKLALSKPFFFVKKVAGVQKQKAHFREQKGKSSQPVRELRLPLRQGLRHSQYD